MGRKESKAQMTLTVGDKVKVNIVEIPEEHRQCEVGEITKMYMKFRATPELRDISITVMFDENYVRKQFRYGGGFSSLSFNSKDINNPDVKYPVYIERINDRKK